MNKILIALSMCLAAIIPSFADSNDLNIEKVLEAAKMKMEYRDVDYYYSDENKYFLQIFVDAEPLSGWEHECYVLTIPKLALRDSLTAEEISNKYFLKQTRKTPPTGNFKKLEVKNRNGVMQGNKAFVPKNPDLNTQNSDINNRTYCIIVSGGISKYSNHERYWNDCSFIYKTLVNKYGIPKENIYPIMSDGDDSEPDQNLISGEFASQKLDLDEDGMKDIYLAATVENIENTISSLSAKMKKDDHFFLYVIDHGGRDSNGSYICLWDGEKLYDGELASLLRPLSNKLVNINVVLGQCNSGGFVDKLNMPGCVVATACKKDQNSYACSDIPYDEFVYQWTCAINGANHKGLKINSDIDNNDRVTMQEAFEYAKSNDRRKYSETPLYLSTPTSIGEDLAFNHLVPEYDLYIMDNEEDTGKEPNNTTSKHWISPSVWIRNYPDSIYEHENPFYSVQHTSAKVFVRIHNRGKSDYEGGKWLHGYWAKASTNFSKSEWKGQELYEGDKISGEHLRAKSIGKIKAGEYIDMILDWTLPSDIFQESDNGTEKHHYCILARIMDTPFDDYKDVDVNDGYNILSDNDLAQKNVSIIYKEDLQKNINVYVKNLSANSRCYSLEFIPQASFDEKLYEKAIIEMTMSPTLYQGWSNGGSQSNNVARVAGKPSTVRFISKESRLSNIDLDAREVGKVSMKINFRAISSNDEKYTFDLIQRDENDSIIGGETFIIQSPTLSTAPVQIISTTSNEGNTILSVENNNDEFSSFTWIDETGNIIDQSATLVASPQMHENEYKVIAFTPEGEASLGSIVLNKSQGIETLIVNQNGIQIKFNQAAPNNAMITISDILNGTNIYTEVVDCGAQEIVIPTSSLSKGSYSVSYSINDEVIDSKKFTIQ